MTHHNIPCDAIWLDIEYTDDKKYFTFDQKSFPSPLEMLHKIESSGRKLVTIIDPHIKKDEEYFVYRDTINKKIYVSLDEAPYEGICWPKLSVWMDFMNKDCRDYIKELYCSVPEGVEDKDNYIWTSNSVHIWNDMNEPACFEKHDKSIHKLGGKDVEHRDVHNTYGYFNT
jgi:alpha 1,3-glucosidase